MDKERIQKLVRLYAWPVIQIVLGLILVFSPDTASALIARVIGWLLIGIGVCTAIAALVVGSYERIRLGVIAALCLGVGIFVTAFPLVLAEALGRFFGIFLIIQCIGDIRKALQKKAADLPWRNSLGIAILRLVIGIELILLPMTLSRISLNICGLALIVTGAINILGIYQEQKALKSGSRPEIIDADE